MKLKSININYQRYFNRKIFLLIYVKAFSSVFFVMCFHVSRIFRALIQPFAVLFPAYTQALAVTAYRLSLSDFLLAIDISETRLVSFLPVYTDAIAPTLVMFHVIYNSSEGVLYRVW